MRDVAFFVVVCSLVEVVPGQGHPSQVAEPNGGVCSDSQLPQQPNSFFSKLRGSSDKNLRACSFLSNSLCRSSGTLAVLGESQAASHRPSTLARSTSRRPEGFISHRSISSVAFLRLTFDHLLLGLRGVNRCR
jgi:hypothetical protein